MSSLIPVKLRQAYSLLSLPCQEHFRVATTINSNNSFDFPGSDTSSNTNAGSRGHRLFGTYYVPAASHLSSYLIIATTLRVRY